MRPLRDLIDEREPAYPLVREWAAAAARPIEILPPSATRDEALYRTQVTTRSAMGAVVHETGGILVDSGWLRLLGSGHQRLTRTLPGWIEGRSGGFYLVADDAVGDFFAINGGALGNDPGSLNYFAPDRLEWEPLGMGYSQFIVGLLLPPRSLLRVDPLGGLGRGRRPAARRSLLLLLRVPLHCRREGRARAPRRSAR